MTAWCRRRMHLASLVLILCPVGGLAQELKPIPLPSPQTEIGRPLMQVLKDRSSARSFSPKELPAQVQSNLLWAAFGVNRPESGKRTAPSAMNWQEIDVYVAAANGLYVYDAKANRLIPVVRDDVRSQTGTQPFVKDAPLNLVYVADLSRTRGSSPERDTYVAADTGFIAQNVYLFCASEGLATVVPRRHRPAGPGQGHAPPPGPEDHPGSDGGLLEEVMPPGESLAQVLSVAELRK